MGKGGRLQKFRWQTPLHTVPASLRAGKCTQSQGKHCSTTTLWWTSLQQHKWVQNSNTALPTHDIPGFEVLSKNMSDDFCGKPPLLVIVFACSIRSLLVFSAGVDDQQLFWRDDKIKRPQRRATSTVRNRSSCLWDYCALETIGQRRKDSSLPCLSL